MQYPVPQFTDVEDKIIGSLTIKQFGILFGVGAVIFLFFSASKSIPVAIISFVIFGLPGLAVAFYPLNGRPMYVSMGYLSRFMSSPKFLVFHKEASRIRDQAQMQTSDGPKQEKPVVMTAETTEQRLKQVNKILSGQRAEEADITKNIP